MVHNAALTTLRVDCPVGVGGAVYLSSVRAGQGRELHLVPLCSPLLPLFLASPLLAHPLPSSALLSSPLLSSLLSSPLLSSPLVSSGPEGAVLIGLISVNDGSLRFHTNLTVESKPRRNPHVLRLYFLR